MEKKGISGENTVFTLVSFEGPDLYSRAGGLGVRVAELGQSLANMGFETHVLFVGDPKKPNLETRRDGKLILHRWSQWVSKYYPEGLYQGEEEKLYDFNESVPWFVCEQILKPAIAQGKLPIVLGEEWHTAEAMSRISDHMHFSGMRHRAIMLWNANNTMSFHRINWGRLGYTNTLMTVSKYMKHIMWRWGVDPLVVPNGIPKRWLKPVDDWSSARLRTAFGDRLVFSKIGRWDPDKRWNMAVETIARLKGLGINSTLVVRGGIEGHEGEVMHNARMMGLTIKDVRPNDDTFESYCNAIESVGPADILNLKFYLPEEFLRVLYHASDGVLANSGHEPFGLVGLEAMAAGGVAYVGSTGEEYAIPMENAVVLDTSDPGEIVSYAIYIKEHPERAEQIRKQAIRTARRFTWENVNNILLEKLTFMARNRDILPERQSSENSKKQDLLTEGNNKRKTKNKEKVATGG